MSEKLPVLITYVLLGILIGMLPILVRFLPQPLSEPRRSMNKVLLGTVIMVPFLTVSFSLSQQAAFVAACISLALFAGLIRGDVPSPIVLSTFVGLMISVTLPYWRRNQDSLPMMSWTELAVFVLITGGALHLLTMTERTTPRNLGVTFILFGTFAIIEIIICFSTGILHNSDALLTAWHHWGAYIGPSEMLRAGARLFRDVPAQYGLGPTLLIAAMGGWRAMYYLVGFSTLLFGFLVAAIAFDVRGRPQGLGSVSVTLALSLFCCLLWTSSPPNSMSPICAPSVSGMRFLPALTMVAWLLWRDRGVANLSGLGWGHAVWAFGVLWSPESAFYVTFVWWPYYLWMHSFERSENGEVFRSVLILRAAGTLLLSLFVLFVCFLAGYWLIYRSTPTAYGYLAYVINPPGPMPINPRGAICFFGSVLALGLAELYTMFRLQINTRECRQAFPIVLLAYATFSYYLGRSHDNQVLNLLPFQMLVLLIALRSRNANSSRMVAAAMLASLIGWSSVFGWNVWKDTIENRLLFEFNPKGLLTAFSYSNPDTAERIRQRFAISKADCGDPADAAKALKYIKKQFGEPVTVLDCSLVLRVTNNGTVWNAFHGPANFYYIPSPGRQEFLVSTAKRLGRTGWLLVDRKFPVDEWSKDFQSAYRIERQLDFQSYYAIRFVPL